MQSTQKFVGSGSAPSSPSRGSSRGASARLRPCAVLAPAEVKSRKQTKSGPSSRGLTDVFASFSKVWGKHEQGDDKVDDLAIRTAERAREADLIEEQEKAKKAQSPPADVSTFLRSVGVMELRYIRMLSHLSAATYAMGRLTDANLRRRHGLRLVTTSLACDIGLRENPHSPRKMLMEGDAMAADPISVVNTREEDTAIGPVSGEVASSDLKPLAAVASLAVTPKASPSKSPLSAADIVANSLSVAAGAAAAAAGSVYSVASPITSNISLFTSSVAHSMPIRTVAAQLQSAAAAGHSSAVATFITVTAALETSFRSDKPAPPSNCMSPTAWFVADSEDAVTRYFVIQGSDNLDHWKVNLTFDPMPFEDPAMGVKAHRGVYETAQILYARFLPLVREHLASSPNAKICFTGHSLGGSLGTMLALMYVRRGVLPRSALTPVYTFGAPAVFCEADACVCAEDGTCRCELEGRGVLARLDLPEGAVRNVMMHRDIVPRAFACDYSLVADLLKKVESFRQHKCLAGSRQLLFNFIGKVMVLQPDDEMTFVHGEGLHPMLPSGAGLYFLRSPPQTTSAATSSTEGLASIDAVGSSDGVSSDDDRAAHVPATLNEAVWELMNNPHPLDILSDPAAYGDAGTISRYHNPDNYTRALGGVLRARKSDWRSLVVRAAEAGVRYHVPQVVAQQPQRREEARSPTGGKGHLGLARHLHHA